MHEKKVGPIIEPWGTPDMMFAEEKDEFPLVKLKFLS